MVKGRRGRVESLMSSLSRRGRWRAAARAVARVVLPVPGWPFMAMINGIVVVLGLFVCWFWW